MTASSIHPQGWVPIETIYTVIQRGAYLFSSIHPQGWVPIETRIVARPQGLQAV